VKSIYRVPHFWIILAIMLFGAITYYADRIPLIQTIVPQTPIELARYSTYRILSIIPVAYAAFVFGLRGGVITAVLISMALLPRAIMFTPQVSEAVTETVAFLLIGLLVSWLIHRQQRAFSQLEKAQHKLQSSVQVIKDNVTRLTALNHISSTVSESLELGNVLSSAIDNVVDVMQADVAWIFLLDEETGKLSLATHRGTAEELAQGVDKLKLGEGFNGRVAQTGQPLYVEDASKDARLTREVVSKFKLHSTLIVPLSSKRKVNGTLCIAMHRHRRFEPEEVDLLTAIGNQIGVAVDNAHLYQQQQVTAQQLRISEERYRGLFENSSDAIFVCSNAARIISINRACEKLTGYTQKELTSTTIYELFSGVSQDKARQLFSEKLEQVTVGGSEEVRLTRKNGTEAFVKLGISPLLRGNEVIGLQVIAQDITEERQLRHNMEYYIKQVTRAQEDERLRISRELHDDTAQVLATLSRDLDSLLTGEKEKLGPVMGRLERLRDMADSALEGVRRFSQDLRPSILDDLGLVPALEWLITDLEKVYGIAAKINITGRQRRLAPEKELAVFRITQEVLSNIGRHSRASEVEMSLDFGDNALTLIISDNGQGFDLPQRTSDLALSGKLGIIGMRERARLIGGTLIVQPEPGTGTTVTLRIPD
jgi:two-component system sensor histidine kinase DegS